MSEDEPESGIQFPFGDPEAIRAQAAAMERAGDAMSEVMSALKDPGRALVMSDGEWLALSAKVEVAQREWAESMGGGERVYGPGPLAGAVEQLSERMVAQHDAQRRQIEELWALARRERPNN